MKSPPKSFCRRLSRLSDTSSSVSVSIESARNVTRGSPSPPSFRIVAPRGSSSAASTKRWDFDRGHSRGMSDASSESPCESSSSLSSPSTALSSSLFSPADASESSESATSDRSSARSRPSPPTSRPSSMSWLPSTSGFDHDVSPVCAL